MISELPGRNESERIGGLETQKHREPSLRMKGEGSIGKQKLAEAFVLFRRGGSGGMVARTYRATGEALPVPGRNFRRR